MKKILAKGFLVVALSVVLLGGALSAGSSALSEGDSCGGKGQESEFAENSLLGLPPWYKYLEGEGVMQKVPDGSGGLEEVVVCQPQIKTESGEEAIPTQSILLIIAAVLEILTRVAGLAAFISLVYGGFMYLTSNGNSENVSKAGSTLLNAAIGLAIAISATAIINFFAGRLGQP